MIYYNTSPSFISSNVGQNKKSERYWTIATAFKNIINKPFLKKKLEPLILDIPLAPWTPRLTTVDTAEAHSWSIPQLLVLHPTLGFASQPSGPHCFSMPCSAGLWAGGSGHLEYILLTWQMIATLNICSTPFHPFP